MIATTEDIEQLRSAVRELCSQFPDEYWREVDQRKDYPQAFVNALTEAGYLAYDLSDF